MKFDSSRILHEDNHLLIINKRAGELVQGDKTGDRSLLEEIKSFIKQRDKKPGNVYLGLPHRLDRPTSGLTVFCKTSKSLGRMSEVFRSRDVQKIYWAVVNKPIRLRSGHLEDYLRKNPTKNKSFVVPAKTQDAKKAILDYQQIAEIDRYALLEVNIHTGRHHQIRAQLAHRDMPIKGDLKYLYPRSNPDGSIHLHSRKINFVHPVSSQEISVESPVPKEKIWQIMMEALKS